MGRPPSPYDLLWPIAKGQKSQPLARVSEENKFALPTNGAASDPSCRCPSSALRGNGLATHLCSCLCALCSRAHSSVTTRSGTYDELRDYARKLVGSSTGSGAGSFAGPNVLDGAKIELPGTVDGLDIERDREREEEGALSGCRQAVEILTRNPKKGQCVVAPDRAAYQRESLKV